MKMHKLGRTDLTVSRVCLGTMTFGQQNTESDAHSQLDYALERGINFIDRSQPDLHGDHQVPGGGYYLWRTRGLGEGYQTGKGS